MSFWSRITSVFRRTGVERSAYARFLLIDEDDVINSMSALEGGKIDEILTKTREVRSKGVSAGMGTHLPTVGDARIKATDSQAGEYEEEVLRKRTVHSATVALLDALHEEEDIHRIQANYGPEAYEQLQENMLLEVRAKIRVHPLHQAVSVLQRWAVFGNSLDLAEDPEDYADFDTDEFADFATKIEERFQDKDQREQVLLVFLETENASREYRLIVPIKKDHLLVPLDEFAGMATFVVQVEHILDEDEQVLAGRLNRNYPDVPPEIELARKTRSILENLFEKQRIGLKIDEKDVVLRKPSVVLRPICIYK
jgi:hypothetical protein